MAQPNFLIVGAAKSGTTSIYHYLKAHPDVFMPEWKEPSYFCPEAGGISDWGEYTELFKNVINEKCIGEASVCYLASKNAPEKIKNKLGNNIKIIILLRNPIAMAYSLWGHEVREGYETKDFYSALKEESYRLNSIEFRTKLNQWHLNLTYINRAKYYDQVKRYIDVFGEKNIAIYLFEEFFRKDMPQFRDLLSFLEINENYIPENKIYNQAGTVRSKILRYLIKNKLILKEPIKLILPKKLRASIVSWLIRYNRVDKKLAPIEKEAEIFLKNKLREDVILLSRLIKRNELLSIWGF